MKVKFVPEVVCIALVAGCLVFGQSASAQEVVEFTVVVESAEGVSNADGESVEEGDEITQESVSDFAFGEGAFLIVRNKNSGITYRVESAADLAFLGNALGTNTNGIVIGRWVVGGGVKSIERSTLNSLNGLMPSVDERSAATPVGP